MKSILFLASLFVITLSSFAQPINPWTPPEYFPSKAVLIEWPFNNNIWPLYSELIKECSEAAEVILVVRNQNEENQIITKLNNDNVPLNNISFVHVPCERMWIRDHGPISVMTDNGVVFIDLDDLADSGLDEDLPTNLANIWGLLSYQLPYIFCGGNFMVDSYNTLFTTTRLYTNNPTYLPSQIDQDFETYMGITDIVTVSAQHNDYWGHIDMQIKLLNDTTFVLSSVSQGSGPNYDTLENNYAHLAALTGPHGKPYHIVRLPKADNWKTYANSLILNNKVIVPIYDHPNDTIALHIYQQLMPQHQIVGINSNSIIGWEGAIHCITMQLFDDAMVTAVKNLSVKDKHVSVFPNPVKHGQDFHLLINAENNKPVILEIINSAGVVVKSVDLKDQTSSISLKAPHSAGHYFIKITFDDNQTVLSSLIIIK